MGLVQIRQETGTGDLGPTALPTGGHHCLSISVFVYVRLCSHCFPCLAAISINQFLCFLCTLMFSLFSLASGHLHVTPQKKLLFLERALRRSDGQQEKETRHVAASHSWNLPSVCIQITEITVWSHRTNGIHRLFLRQIYGIHRVVAPNEWNPSSVCDKFTEFTVCLRPIHGIHRLFAPNSRNSLLEFPRSAGPPRRQSPPRSPTRGTRSPAEGRELSGGWY